MLKRLNAFPPKVKNKTNMYAFCHFYSTSFWGSRLGN
jgi:hypothetical protein